MITKQKKLLVIVVGVAILVSCAAKAPSPPSPEPLPFDIAIRTLTVNLLTQIKVDVRGSEEIPVVIAPFVNAHSAEVLTLSLMIQNMMIEHGKTQFKDFNLMAMSYESYRKAAYIIDGQIGFEPLKTGDTEKYYYISAVAGNIGEAAVVGKTTVWIADRKLDYKPTAIYRDSPFYIESKHPTKSYPADTGHPGMELEKNYFESIEFKAFLTDADAAYENGDYERALNLFTRAAEYPTGKKLIAYTGLYLTNTKLGRMNDAETAFEKMIAISVEQYRTLTVKFLFDVNSIQFVYNHTLREQYDRWLKLIGKFFHATDHCLEIVGHCSCTGKEAWNAKLSLNRAEVIQKRLQPTFPEIMKRSKSVGKGASENIVGSCSDDELDALDRRVEILIVPCAGK